MASSTRWNAWKGPSDEPPASSPRSPRCGYDPRPREDARSPAVPRAARRRSRSRPALRCRFAAAPGPEDPLDLLVLGGGEVFVPEPDRVEGLGRRRADHSVDLAGEGLAALRRGDGHCDDDLARILSAKRFRGGAHGGSGGQAVVHQDDRAARDLGRRAITAVQPLALPQLPDRAPERPAQLLLGNALGERRVEEHHSPRSDGAHGELLVAREADLANDVDVEGGAEPARNGFRHGHAPARQREDQEVRSATEVLELVGEPFARVPSVAIERHAAKLGTAPLENNQQSTECGTPPERHHIPRCPPVLVRLGAAEEIEGTMACAARADIVDLTYARPHAGPSPG